MHASILRGIDETSFSQYSGVISIVQADLIASTSSLWLETCLAETLSFNLTQQFSIGFKSGDCPGHGARTSNGELRFNCERQDMFYDKSPSLRLQFEFEFKFIDSLIREICRKVTIDILSAIDIFLREWNLIYEW